MSFLTVIEKMCNKLKLGDVDTECRMLVPFIKSFSCFRHPYVGNYKEGKYFGEKAVLLIKVSLRTDFL